MVDCSCATNHAHPKQLQNTAGFQFAFVSGKSSKLVKKKIQVTQQLQEVTNLCLAMFSGVSGSVPGFKFHSFQHQSEEQPHAVSQQNVVFLPILLKSWGCKSGVVEQVFKFVYVYHVHAAAKVTFITIHQAKSKPIHLTTVCAGMGYLQTYKQPCIDSAMICLMCGNKINI